MFLASADIRLPLVTIDLVVGIFTTKIRYIYCMWYIYVYVISIYTYSPKKQVSIFKYIYHVLV